MVFRKKMLLALSVLGLIVIPVSAINFAHALFDYQSGSTIGVNGSDLSSFTGVQAQIAIGPQSLPESQDLAAYWVSLDCFTPNCPTQYWLQAGYIVGTAPNSMFYSQPVIYFEYNIPGTYHFETRGTVSDVSCSCASAWHTFSVWTSGTTGYIAIDGTTVATVANIGFSTGNLGAAAEIHQATTTSFVTSSQGCPPCYALAYWKTILYQRGGTGWILWGNSCGFECYTSVSTGTAIPYHAGYVGDASANSQEVTYGQTGGGGCGCRRD